MLGSTEDEVSYRNGEPDKIELQDDGSTVWIYENLGRGYLKLPSGALFVDEIGVRSVYYFSSDSKIGLYSTQFSMADGEKLSEITKRLG